MRVDINKQKGVKMNSPEETKVVVTDIQMLFISMVVFMVKWALAAIPAFLILGCIFPVPTGILHAARVRRALTGGQTETCRPPQLE